MTTSIHDLRGIVRAARRRARRCAYSQPAITAELTRRLCALLDATGGVDDRGNTWTWEAGPAVSDGRGAMTTPGTPGRL